MSTITQLRNYSQKEAGEFEFNLFVETVSDDVAKQVWARLCPSARQPESGWRFDSIQEATRYERQAMLHGHPLSTEHNMEHEEHGGQFTPMDAWLGAYYAGEIERTRIVWAHEIEDILKGGK